MRGHQKCSGRFWSAAYSSVRLCFVNLLCLVHSVEAPRQHGSRRPLARWHSLSPPRVPPTASRLRCAVGRVSCDRTRQGVASSGLRDRAARPREPLRRRTRLRRRSRSSLGSSTGSPQGIHEDPHHCLPHGVISKANPCLRFAVAPSSGGEEPSHLGSTTKLSKTRYFFEHCGYHASPQPL